MFCNIPLFLSTAVRFRRPKPLMFLITAVTTSTLVPRELQQKLLLQQWTPLHYKEFQSKEDCLFSTSWYFVILFVLSGNAFPRGKALPDDPITAVKETANFPYWRIFTFKMSFLCLTKLWVWKRVLNLFSLSPGQTRMRVAVSLNSRSRLAQLACALSNSHTLLSNLNLFKFFLSIVKSCLFFDPGWWEWKKTLVRANS